MKNELSTELVGQMCIRVRGGIDIWVSKEKAETLMQAIEQDKVRRFVRIDDQFVNIADIQGIFPYGVIEETRAEKDDTWTCAQGATHNKREYCHCLDR